MKAKRVILGFVQKLIPGFYGLLAILAAVMAAAGNASAATNDLSAMLQKGLFEEEANRDLDAAIQSYQAVVARMDKDRQYAATAVFRLGECYRKQGKTNEAAAQYQRILRQFPEEAELVKLSREQLGPAAGQSQEATADKGTIEDSPQKSEEAEVRRIQAMIKDSPDLINAGRPRPGGFAGGNLGDAPLLKAAKLNQLVVARFLLDNKADTEVRAREGGSTPLMVAAEAGHKDMVELLLDRGADANASLNLPNYNPGFGSQKNGATSLHYAAQGGHKEEVAALLAHGAKANAVNDEGETPLYLAAVGGFKTVAELLLAHGADVNTKARSGVTALHAAAGAGNKAIVELLLSNKANVNATDNSGETPLYKAASGGYAAVVELLLAHRADVNTPRDDGATAAQHGTASFSVGASGPAPLQYQWRNNNTGNGPNVENLPTITGMTPLMAAIQQHHEEVAELLLARGADPKPRMSKDDSSHGGWAALHFAVEADDAAITRSLLEKGADVDATAHVIAVANLSDDQAYYSQRLPGGRLNSPPMMGPDNNQNFTFHEFTPLMLAIFHEKKELAQILLTRKADVNFRNEYGETPLLVAVARRSKEMVELLLDHNADAKTTDKNGWSLLHHAAQAERKDIAELLLAHGVDPKRQIPTTNGASWAGWTAIHFAAVKAQVGMANSLLRHGADINARAADGTTPLEVAIGYNLREMVEFLLAQGADVNLKDRSGRSPLDYVNGNNANEIANLLRQHGAHSALERDTIRVTRVGQSAPGIVFWRDANGNNHHTVFEVIAYLYPHQLGLAVVAPSSQNDRGPGLSGFNFPDFAGAKIRRLDSNGQTNVLSVDLESALMSGDCAKNPMLNWGDVVELPELDHYITDPWSGLPQPVRETLKKCLARHVEIIVKGKSTRVELAPNLTSSPLPGTRQFSFPRTMPGGGARELSLPGAAAGALEPAHASPNTELPSFWLSEVLRGANVILASSDLTKVKVKRADPATGKTVELVFNMEHLDAHSDLWLQDGDVIEVPEKP